MIDVDQIADVNYANLAGLGDIKYTKAAVINGKQSNLLAVFADPKKALDLEKQKNHKILEILSTKFNLPQLSSDNWRQYYFVTERYIDEYNLVTNDWFHGNQDLWREFSELEAFLDIYGDTFSNEQAQNYILSANKGIKSGAVNQFPLDNLISNFSDDQPIQEDARQAVALQNSEKNKNLWLTNISEANQYALEYATRPNDAYYNFDEEGGDCTNFVSQICLAGGVPLDGTWRYTMMGSKRYGSATWRMAQLFKAYFGDRWHRSMSIPSNFTEWTHQLYARGGAVIGRSSSDNDHYGHLAYVIARSNTMYTNPYDGEEYYDFEVAQHSYFLCGWASTGHAGRWLDHGNDIYGILS